jgi:hypothetical protein
MDKNLQKLAVIGGLVTVGYLGFQPKAPDVSQAVANNNVFDAYHAYVAPSDQLDQSNGSALLDGIRIKITGHGEPAPGVSMSPEAVDTYNKVVRDSRDAFSGIEVPGALDKYKNDLAAVGGMKSTDSVAVTGRLIVDAMKAGDTARLAEIRQNDSVMKDMLVAFGPSTNASNIITSTEFLQQGLSQGGIPGLQGEQVQAIVNGSALPAPPATPTNCTNLPFGAKICR